MNTSALLYSGRFVSLFICAVVVTNFIFLPFIRWQTSMTRPDGVLYTVLSILFVVTLRQRIKYKIRLLRHDLSMGFVKRTGSSSFATIIKICSQILVQLGKETIRLVYKVLMVLAITIVLLGAAYTNSFFIMSYL